MTDAGILPNPDGPGWLVAWKTERMTEHQLWLYATQAEAEQVAATFRGENVTPLPAPPAEVSCDEPPSPATGVDLYCAAQDAGLVDVLFPLEPGQEPLPSGDPWDFEEMERERLADEAAARATREAKRAELLPWADGVTSRGTPRVRVKPKRRRPSEAGGQSARRSAAYVREINRLHAAGVLDRAEARLMLGLEPEPVVEAAKPWWRRGAA